MISKKLIYLFQMECFQCHSQDRNLVYQCCGCDKRFAYFHEACLETYRTRWPYCSFCRYPYKPLKSRWIWFFRTPLSLVLTVGLLATILSLLLGITVFLTGTTPEQSSQMVLKGFGYVAMLLGSIPFTDTSTFQGLWVGGQMTKDPGMASLFALFGGGVLCFGLYCVVYQKIGEMLFKWGT